MTTPERYTSVGGEVPLTFPAVAEPMIGTDDGRVVAPVFRGVNHDLADLGSRVPGPLAADWHDG